jgi:hypothetical protein
MQFGIEIILPTYKRQSSIRWTVYRSNFQGKSQLNREIFAENSNGILYYRMEFYIVFLCVTYNRECLRKLEAFCRIDQLRRFFRRWWTCFYSVAIVSWWTCWDCIGDSVVSLLWSLWRVYPGDGLKARCRTVTHYSNQIVLEIVVLEIVLEIPYYHCSSRWSSAATVVEWNLQYNLQLPTCNTLEGRHLN